MHLLYYHHVWERGVDQPAWVIADLILSKYRGQPLSEYEEALISQPFQSEGLTWLTNVCKHFKEA